MLFFRCLRSLLPRRSLSSIILFRRSTYSQALWVPAFDHIDTSHAPDSYDESAVVCANVISDDESAALVSDLTTKLQRRRYEKGHWDDVIVHYKETELLNETELSNLSQSVLQRIRTFAWEQHDANSVGSKSNYSWLPCHVIDLSPTGQINAHVDSVRFSGRLVCGLSLLSPSIMRLRPAPAPLLDSDDDKNDDYRAAAVHVPASHHGFVDLLLPPNSLYVLSNDSRYRYTHELLPSGSFFRNTVVVRDHRLSIIFRDTK